MAWMTFSLLLIGIGCNTLIIKANNGKMPVATQKEDILFVIGRPEYGVKYFYIADDTDERHQALTAQTKMRILADRIPISFQFVHPSKLPQWSYTILDRIQIRPGYDGIASIGDLFIWSGLVLSTLVIPTLTAFLMWMTFHNIRRKN